MLRSEAVPMLNVDIYSQGSLMRLVDAQKKSGKTYLGIVGDSFRRGSTIRVRDVDQSDVLLRRFQAEAQRYFAARSQINLYLTPPGNSGFPPHFDITDVFVVQCVGAIEWKAFQRYTNHTVLPLPETDWDPDRFQPCGSGESLRMCAGDVLYLPRGVMHQAFCTDRESLHLTISIEPLTVVDLLAKALRAAAAKDPALRQRVEWSLETAGAEADELTAELASHMKNVMDRIDVGELLKSERVRLAGQPGPGNGHELQSVIDDFADHSKAGADEALLAS
jgi:ribosomal protein L16 Arg81 hydroxylase